MVDRIMYCNNCGQSGHVFRSCPLPVISCGILFIRGTFEPMILPVNPNTVGILMVRRKDSMSYMEFVRGKYDLHDMDYLKKQLQNMTIAEQQTVLTESFETLWTRLWGNSRDLHSLEYETAKQKFESLNLKSLISEVPSRFQEPEWGFPKGRRMRGETDVQAAEREFFEETNIPKEAYTLREDLTFSETFIGTNGIRYKHIYFVALMKDSKIMNLKQKFTQHQRREISNIGWKTLKECKQITRPHYSERKKMITELERMVSLPSK
jgi:8-oxo-dGTP pyrophosphatase MutT (NUDIX family)